MENRILEIMEKVFKTEVNENITQNLCNEWDSLRHLNLIIELEKEFDASFEPEEISEMTSYNKINEILKARNNE